MQAVIFLLFWILLICGVYWLAKRSVDREFRDREP